MSKATPLVAAALMAGLAALALGLFNLSGPGEGQTAPGAPYSAPGPGSRRIAPTVLNRARCGVDVDHVPGGHLDLVPVLCHDLQVPGHGRGFFGRNPVAEGVNFFVRSGRRQNLVVAHELVHPLGPRGCRNKRVA